MSEFPYLNEDHEQVRDMVRDFAENEVKPVARELDSESQFLWPTVKKMGELGFLGAPWDEELGGSGMDETFAHG